jgi:hypothetical protein
VTPAGLDTWETFGLIINSIYVLVLLAALALAYSQSLAPHRYIANPLPSSTRTIVGGLASYDAHRDNDHWIIAGAGLFILCAIGIIIIQSWAMGRGDLIGDNYCTFVGDVPDDGDRLVMENTCDQTVAAGNTSGDDSREDLREKCEGTTFADAPGAKCLYSTTADGDLLHWSDQNTDPVQAARPESSLPFTIVTLMVSLILTAISMAVFIYRFKRSMTSGGVGENNLFIVSITVSCIVMLTLFAL